MVNRNILFCIIVIAILTLSAAGAWAGEMTEDEKETEEEGGVGMMLAASAVAPNMNYQGRLLDNGGNPVTDPVKIAFSLYDDPEAGTLLWTETKTVSVTDGLFNTNLSSLNVGDFDQTLWLEIAVEGETLSPRQQLMCTPYAFSLVPGAEMLGSLTRPLLTVNNTNWHGIEGLSYNGDGVRGISYGGGVADYGVYGETDSIGSSDAGVYGKSTSNAAGGRFRSDEGDGVYARSYGSDSYDDGVYAYSTNGRGVYGYSTNNTGGYFWSDEGDGVYAYSTGSDDGDDGVYASSNEGDGVYAISYGSGSYDDGVYAYSKNGRGVRGYSVNNTGVYGYSHRYTSGEFPSGGIGVYGQVRSDTVDGAGVKGVGPFGVVGEGTSFGVSAKATSTHGTGIYALGGSSGYAAIFSGNVIIRDRSSGATIMELGEGLDYAEGFDVSDPDMIDPGTVLIIDPDNPGKLTVSDTPYDTMVAGIVAGANGMSSGVRLGVDQFDYDVALAGRAYCNVDATEAGVEPGDLLTTSATSGYAMKSTDYERAQGAILGKAMEKLEEGEKGQILVLVTLQ